MPDKQFQYKSSGKSIPYEELDLERPREAFDIQHELTRKGIEKFAADLSCNTLPTCIARLNCDAAFALEEKLAPVSGDERRANGPRLRDAK